MQSTERTFLILLAFCFAPAIAALAEVWASSDTYSHGFLVPVVSVWAAWRRWPAARALPSRTGRRGTIPLAMALGLYFWSLSTGSVSGQGAALVLAVAAALWLLRGSAWLRHFAFPVGYLIFMVPIPASWISPGIVQLQLWVSQSAIAVLHTFGVAVAREGNVLLLPGGGSLFVAEACSGVTSVITLTPLAVLLAHWTALPVGRALVLCVAVVPLAMFANLLRVTGTVAAARAWGVDVVTGEPLHSIAGLGVYVLACLALVGLWAVLSGAGPEGRPAPRA